MRTHQVLIILAATLALWGAVVALSPKVAQAHSGCATTYVVRRGDWLAAIARRFHTTVNELVRLNPKLYWRMDSIYPGETLCMPGQRKAPSSPAQHKSELPPAGFSLHLEADYTIRPSTSLTWTLQAPMTGLGRRIVIPLQEPDASTFISQTQEISATLSGQPAPVLLVFRNDDFSPDFTLYEVGSSDILASLRLEDNKLLSLGADCEARPLSEAFGLAPDEPMTLTAWLEDPEGTRFPFRISQVGMVSTSSVPLCPYNANESTRNLLAFALFPTGVAQSPSYRVVLHAYQIGGPCFGCIIRRICGAFGRHGRYVCRFAR